MLRRARKVFLQRPQRLLAGVAIASILFLILSVARCVLHPPGNLTVDILKQREADAATLEMLKQREAHAQLMKKYSPQAVGCNMPQLRADDPVLAGYFNVSVKIVCVKESDWVYVDSGIFYISEEAIKSHGSIQCTCKPFTRKDDHNVIFGSEYGIESATKMKDEFSRIFCRASDGKKFDTIIAVPIENASKMVAKTDEFSKSLGLNVLFLGFDSVSHMSALRKWKQTVSLLQKLNAVVLDGYNIVGDGTPQALVPMLTGFTEIELPNTRKRYFPKSSYVNAYNFVWDKFSQAGYVTMFGEENVNYGIFTYRLNGFNPQPTNHYLRTFCVEAHKDYRKYPQDCLGSRKRYQVMLNYTLDLWKIYPKDRKKFAFTFLDLCHDDINRCGDADEYLAASLANFHVRGYLNDTIVFLISDHGSRFSTTFAQYRNTQQGKLEERLPLFSVIIPERLRTEYPIAAANLAANARKLTTPFDIHATLEDLLNFGNGKREPDLWQRSISLFDSIPHNRSCLHADVEPHWCACLQWKNTSINSPLVRKVAWQIVNMINDYTSPYRHLCSPLNLSSINEVLAFAPDTSVFTFKKARDLDGFIAEFSDSSTTVTEIMLQMKLVTTPGHALYEVSAAWNSEKNATSTDPSQVSILTKYGDRPHCVEDQEPNVRKFCVCYDKIS